MSLSVQKFLGFLTLALLLAAAPSAWAATAGTTPPRKLTVILDWFVNPNHAPLVIGDRMGLFRQHGLDVTLIAPADPQDAPKLVAAGKADLGVGYQTQLYLQVAAGLPLARVGALIDQPLSTLAVLKDSGITSLADLKGKRIGVSVGNVEAALLQTMLGRHGLGLNDVTLVHVNFALTPALLSRRVDAIMGAYRNVELPQLALAGHPARAFLPEENGVPPREALIFLANPERLDRPATRAFLAAIAEATARLRAAPEATFHTFRKAYPETDTALTNTAWPLTLPLFADDPAALDAARYQAVAAYLAAHGLIPEALPVSRYAVTLD